MGADPMDAPNVRENLTYEITNPNTGKVYLPPTGRCWRFSQDKLEEALKENRILFGKTGRSRPQYKRFLSEARARGVNVPTIWDDVGTATSGTRELIALFGRENLFDTPKPTDLIQRIIRIATGPDAVVLDSFAGSGTTAQAVLALNNKDGGSRKFILVECEDYADTITAERVRRVIAGVPEARDDALREGLGGTFTYCELGDPITVEGMLRGDALPGFPALAAWLLHTATGVSAGTTQLHAMDEDGHFYSDEQRDYYLLYEPNVEWLQNEEAALNEARAKRIGAGRSKEAIVFGAAKYISQQDLTAEYHITFCQLPYEIHRLR